MFSVNDYFKMLLLISLFELNQFTMFCFKKEFNTYSCFSAFFEMHISCIVNTAVMLCHEHKWFKCTLAIKPSGSTVLP